ncbi:hypothetical protein SeseC_02344 [Streptococcus equi subsp. zooepidemicus ATCC 35246]|nr:hypothetical protein SeseC_02344 [Streptococcus equi subsp. zooepidemicus ATCC 35246]
MDFENLALKLRHHRLREIAAVPITSERVSRGYFPLKLG